MIRLQPRKRFQPTREVGSRELLRVSVTATIVQDLQHEQSFHRLLMLEGSNRLNGCESSAEIFDQI
ncbi:MAG: hypothetical protein ACRDOI_34190 [Trebonia sp.]